MINKAFKSECASVPLSARPSRPSCLGCSTHHSVRVVARSMVLTGSAYSMCASMSCGDYREFFIRRLRSHFDLDHARGGWEALRQINDVGPGAKRFDIVLLDQNMPDMNGTSFLRRMRGDPRCQHIPVIVISEADTEETIAQCLNAGANFFMSKSDLNRSLLLRLCVSMSYAAKERIRRTREINRRRQRGVASSVHGEFCNGSTKSHRIRDDFDSLSDHDRSARSDDTMAGDDFQDPTRKLGDTGAGTGPTADAPNQAAGGTNADAARKRNRADPQYAAGPVAGPIPDQKRTKVPVNSSAASSSRDVPSGSDWRRIAFESNSAESISVIQSKDSASAAAVSRRKRREARRLSSRDVLDIVMDRLAFPVPHPDCQLGPEGNFFHHIVQQRCGFPKFFAPVVYVRVLQSCNRMPAPDSAMTQEIPYITLSEFSTFWTPRVMAAQQTQCDNWITRFCFLIHPTGRPTLITIDDIKPFIRCLVLYHADLRRLLDVDREADLDAYVQGVATWLFVIVRGHQRPAVTSAQDLAPVLQRLYMV